MGTRDLGSQKSLAPLNFEVQSPNMANHCEVGRDTDRGVVCAG